MPIFYLMGKNLMSCIYGVPTVTDIEKIEIRYKIAAHPNTPENILKELAFDPSINAHYTVQANIRYAVLENHNLPQ